MKKTAERLVAVCVIAILSVSSTGCLSLAFGGKTVNCGGKHEQTDAQIAVLEQRLAALEQYAGISPPQKSNDPAAHPVIVASAVSEAPLPPAVR